MPPYTAKVVSERFCSSVKQPTAVKDIPLLNK